jgi:hypothetical protein
VIYLIPNIEFANLPIKTAKDLVDEEPLMSSVCVIRFSYFSRLAGVLG